MFLIFLGVIAWQRSDVNLIKFVIYVKSYGNREICGGRLAQKT